MVEGHPDEGVLPSGQVAAVIDALPPVAEVIDAIVREAEARLAALGALSPPVGHPSPASGRGEGERAARSAEAPADTRKSI